MHKVMRGLWLAVLVAASVAEAQVELVPGVRLIRGSFDPGQQPDGNTVVIDAPDGLVVIDTGRHASHTRLILDHAKAVGRPIAAVVNTHWHLDHIGGNAAIRAAHPDVRVHATDALEAALTGFLSRYRAQLQEAIASTKDPAQRKAFESEVQLIDAGKKLAPDVVIASSGQRRLAGRTFTVGRETNSVTAGDVWILDESRGVLVAGDLVTLPVPFLDTACPANWRASLDRLAAIDFDLLVPGHGAPLTKRQFDSYRLGFGALLDCAATTAEKERCTNGWIAATAGLASDDEKFTRSLMGYYMDVLRGDAAKTRAGCGD